MDIVVRNKARLATIAVALVVAAGVVILGWGGDPAESAIPKAQQVGRITYRDLAAGNNITIPIRSFRFDVVRPGGGNASFEAVEIVQEVSDVSPSFMNSLASGKVHLNFTVVLFHPDSEKRFQQFRFTDTVLTQDRQVNAAPRSKGSVETVAFRFDQVRQTTYRPNGTTEVHTSCWDTSSNGAC